MTPTWLLALAVPAFAAAPPSDAELAAWFATDLEVATMPMKQEDEQRALDERVASRSVAYDDLVRRLQAAAPGTSDAAGLHHQVTLAKVHEDQAYTLMHAPAPTWMEGDAVPAWERTWLDRAAGPCAAARAAWTEAARLAALLGDRDDADSVEARYGVERLQITEADRRLPDAAGPLFVPEETDAAGPLDDLPPHLLACRRVRDW